AGGFPMPDPAAFDFRRTPTEGGCRRCVDGGLGECGFEWPAQLDPADADVQRGGGAGAGGAAPGRGQGVEDVPAAALAADEAGAAEVLEVVGDVGERRREGAADLPDRPRGALLEAEDDAEAFRL